MFNKIHLGVSKGVKRRLSNMCLRCHRVCVRGFCFWHGGGGFKKMKKDEVGREAVSRRWGWSGAGELERPRPPTTKTSRREARSDLFFHFILKELCRKTIKQIIFLFFLEFRRGSRQEGDGKKMFYFKKRIVCFSLLLHIWSSYLP